MPQFSTTRRVHHAALDMFALVADVERYPEFVPLCRKLVVRRRTLRRNGVEVLTAEMTVGRWVGIVPPGALSGPAVVPPPGGHPRPAAHGTGEQERLTA